MRAVVTAFALLFLLAAAVSAALPGAALGSAFADAYASFAPLYEFYRTYADHLFSGTSVEVPAGMDTACSEYAEALQALHLVLITQTASSTAETLGYLVRLRSDVESFCGGFNATWADIAVRGAPGEDTLDRLAADGLFVSIYDLNRLFEGTLSAALTGSVDDWTRWNLSVTFAVRGLVRSPKLLSISTGIEKILYGHAGANGPPFNVPDDVAAAMATLTGLAGEMLSVDQTSVAVDEAQRIYDYFMTGT